MAKKLTFPENCPHKQFFGCKNPSECVGCYYNPDKKYALMLKRNDDEPKTAKNNWFYNDKKHSKICLDMLDDIKNGRGLLKGGTRCYFKNARKGDENINEEN